MTLTVNIRRRLSATFAVDVSFTAPPGITILFGPSGSGKTTILRAVAGLTRPDAGRIAIGDRVLFDGDAGIDIPVQHRHVGYVFQQLALFPHLTIGDNIGYGLSALVAAERKARVRTIAESFGIAGLLERAPDRVSGGERQRAALARALVGDPSILLLDEPLSALDHRIRSRIMDDLRQWNERRELPMLYVTHSQDEAFGLGDQVIVLERGEVEEIGVPHEVLERPSRGVLANLTGFENVFDATVVARDERRGLMRCRLEASAAHLLVPLTTTPVGGTLRIAVRAGDIIVANQEPTGLSAHNLLPARFVAAHPRASGVEAHFDAGTPFVAHVAPDSLAALGIGEGSTAWLVIKSYSCRILAR